MTLSEYIEKKEKAIATLETVKYELSNQVASKYCRAKYEATEMAIKALEQQSSDDCVSRASVKELFQEGCVMGMYDFLGIDDLPPVTPTHGTCKDCRWLTTDENDNYYCKQTGDFDSLDWYCADFEKRGSENE